MMPQTSQKPAAKSLPYGSDARQGMLDGIALQAKFVGATLGPAGRCIILQEPSGPPISTKDGVTVSQAIYVSDPLKQVGIDMVKGVADKTVEATGDGTTTATILAHAIYEKGLNAINKGANPVALRKGIEKAVEKVCKNLDVMAIPVSGDMIAQVGTISANNDASIGALIADAMKKAGRDGIVAMGDSDDFSTKLEVIEGMQFEGGYVDSNFVDDLGKQECTLENVYILMFEKKLSALSPAIPLLNEVKARQGSILVIAEDIENDALAVLVMNNARHVIKACAVRIPGHPNQRGAVLQDIAALVGGTPISAASDLSIKDVVLVHLGHAAKVIIGKNSTLITGTKGEGVEKRVVE